MFYLYALLLCLNAVLSITISSEVSERQWQPTPVLLPGKCHGQRSLAGYSLNFLKSTVSKIKNFFFNTISWEQLSFSWKGFLIVSRRNHLKFKITIVFYLFMALLGVCCCARRLSLVAVSRGYSLLQCLGLSLWWLLLSQSTGSRVYGLQHL